MNFLTPPLPHRRERAGDSGADPPDSARAQARRRVSVADVPAADPVPVGAPAQHPPLVPAAAARRGHPADRRGVRAPVLPAGRAGGRAGRAAHARSSCCSISRRAWATAITGSRRARRHRSDRDGLRGEDRATLVLFAQERRGERPRDRRSAAPGRRRSTPRRSRRARRATVRRSSWRRASSTVAAQDARKWCSSATSRRPAGPAPRKSGCRRARCSRRSRSPGQTTSNVSIPSVAFARASFSGQERITVTAGIVNRGDERGQRPDDDARSRRPPDRVEAGDDRRQQLDLGVVRAVHARRRLRPRHGARRHRPAAAGQRVSFRADAEPSGVGAGRGATGGERRAQRPEPLSLSKALSIGTTPAFQVEVTSAAAHDARQPGQARGRHPERHAVSAGGCRRRAEAVRRAGRRPARGARRAQHVAAERRRAAARHARGSVDRPDGRGGALGFLDYSHPVFEVFKAPRSGDFSSTRVFRYRALTATPASRVLARFDDGAVAATEQRVGLGRVIAWNTTFDDSWSDLPTQAGLSAARPSAHAVPRPLRRAGGVADRRTGARSDVRVASSSAAGAIASRSRRRARA